VENVSVGAGLFQRIFVAEENIPASWKLQLHFEAFNASNFAGAMARRDLIEPTFSAFT